MQCLWTICRKTLRCLSATLTLVAVMSAGVTPPWRTPTPLSPLTNREQSLRRVPAHTAEFAPLYASTLRQTCASTRLPEALLTPDPMMQDSSDDVRVRVSFIVGPDGHVHSAFILDSGGRDQDRAILRAVGHWRYRPALCNGVPTPMEARVSFVLH